jgi:hypothetical protein
MKSERIQAGNMIKVTQIGLLALPTLATATSVANTTVL